MQWDPPWLTASQQALVAQLLQSHQRAFGRPLFATAQKQSLRLDCQELFACGFPVLAHGLGKDPQLTYANAAALKLWETNWAELINMPSRLTAPESERDERKVALGQAQHMNAVQDYRGIRISRKGRQFMINNARIWVLWDAKEQVFGQAACFSDWWWLNT